MPSYPQWLCRFWWMILVCILCMHTSTLTFTYRPVSLIFLSKLIEIYTFCIILQPDFNFWLNCAYFFLPFNFLGEQAMQIVKTVNGYWNVQFKEVQKRDEGEYFCVATNTHAVPPSRTSRSAIISVGGECFFLNILPCHLI